MTDTSNKSDDNTSGLNNTCSINEFATDEQSTSYYNAYIEERGNSCWKLYTENSVVLMINSNDVADILGYTFS